MCLLWNEDLMKKQYRDTNGCESIFETPISDSTFQHHHQHWNDDADDAVSILTKTNIESLRWHQHLIHYDDINI